MLGHEGRRVCDRLDYRRPCSFFGPLTGGAT